MTDTTTTVKLVVEKLSSGRTIEDITVLLFMNELFKTKAEARKYVTDIQESHGLVEAKKVPMSEQLKTWFHAQPDPLKVTKKQIEDQIKYIGMSGGSVAWYVRVYMEVINISSTLIRASKFVGPIAK